MGRLIHRHAWALIGLLLSLCMAVTGACALSPQASSTQTPARSPTSVSGPLGQLTRFPLPPGVPGLNRLTVGSDGSLWLTAFNVAHSSALLSSDSIDDAIVRFTPPAPGAPRSAPSATKTTIPTTGDFTTFPLPTPDTWPDGITLGPDGALWFTEFYGDAVGRITLHGHITEFLVPPRPGRASGDGAESQPHDIVAGPDGNLWFDDSGGNKIGRITSGGVVTEFPLPAHPENPNGSGPYGMAVGADGAVWFTELMGMRIGRITVNGHITEYKLPGINHVPGDIVAGGDGALWFTESTQNLLGRITEDGRITEYPLPHTPCNTAGVTGPNVIGVCFVGDLVAGPDGGVWFTEGWRDALGRIDASGHITEFPVPQLSKTDSGMPQQLAIGPDCALWFSYGEGIGRVQPFSTAPGCPSMQRAHESVVDSIGTSLGLGSGAPAASQSPTVDHGSALTSEFTQSSSLSDYFDVLRQIRLHPLEPRGAQIFAVYVSYQFLDIIIYAEELDAGIACIDATGHSNAASLPRASFQTDSSIQEVALFIRNWRFDMIGHPSPELRVHAVVRAARQLSSTA